MREIRKSRKLDDVCYDIRGPVLSEAQRLEEEGFHIMKLNTGNPYTFGFNAPDELLHDIVLNLHNAQGYIDSKGLFFCPQGGNAVLPANQDRRSWRRGRLHR